MHRVLEFALMLLVPVLLLELSSAQTIRDTRNALVDNWQSSWRTMSTPSAAWSLQSRIPMNTKAPEQSISRVGRSDYEEIEEANDEARGKGYKKYKKYMLPLLLAYKLKFFTLIPVLMGGLILLTGATGLAGFFFALFAATMGLKGGGEH